MSFLKLLSVTFVICIVEGSGIVPEQIHLSSTGDASEMIVMWTTFDPTNDSTVQYGDRGANLTNTANGDVVKFVDGGSKHTVRYIHTVKLTGLKPASKYDYQVGCSDNWSKVFTMTTLNNGTNWSPRLAIYGDMGSTNAKSLPTLESETDAAHFDAILHVGDFAYDLATDDGNIGDDFMNNIQDVATRVPYMTAVGNHENAYNFSHYINRFTMPGNHANYYYSWDVGNAHFVIFSTEVYFYTQYGVELIGEQFNWLEQDLKAANARTDRPWIITAGHRPMYCSTNDNDDCDQRESIIRTGYSSDHLYALEPLFHKYGVDIALWAHEHEYQRMWPVYDRQVYNGSYDHPYVNPGATVHLITGSAGCREYHDRFAAPMPWDAARYLDYGYSHMTIVNSTHIRWLQISVDKGGEVIDEIYVVRTKGYPSWLAQ